MGKLKNKIKELNILKTGKTNLKNRDLWLEKALSGIPAGYTILDAGAGELQYKKYCKHLKYTSQDFGQYNGDNDEKGLQTGEWDNTKLDIISDITNIPVDDSSFQAIMCIEVFEHIPEPIKAIKEFSRILKEGGVLIITTPVCSLTHFAPFYFYNGYSRFFYEKILPEYGFKIEELSYNGNWFEYIAQELNRLPYMLGRYAGYRNPSPISFLIRVALLPLLFLLSKASARDKNSNELLSFGIHLKVVKNE